jgi:hypothetical protein
MELPNIRTWIMFYLISFVMLWVSLFLVIVIVGINFFALYNQMKLRDSRKEIQRNLVQGFERGQMDDDSKRTR